MEGKEKSGDVTIPVILNKSKDIILLAEIMVNCQ
jgi:hypothetical protein